MERYDAARDAWTSAAPLLSPRFNLALVATGKRLYAIGGSGADRKPLASVDVYDLEQDRWQPGPALPQPLSNFGAAVLGQQIHAVLHQWHFVLEVGNPGATWRRIVPMPTSRHGLGLAALGGALYAAGGCSEDPQRDLPTLEVYASEV
jgi:N-acetylneuraminic acid mutarotase